MNKIPIDSAQAYASWFEHEKKTRSNVGEEHREWMICTELPSRARHPDRWWRIDLDVAVARGIRVDSAFAGWSELGKPDGNFACVLQSLLAGQSPPTSVRVREIAESLQISPVAASLFESDPLVLRMADGHLFVVEGHHRSTALCLLTGQRKFVAHVAEP